MGNDGEIIFGSKLHHIQSVSKKVSGPHTDFSFSKAVRFKTKIE
jgi:hypothetical protein